MSAFSEYESFDAVGLAELVRRGEVPPAELLEAAIARAERLNPALNAIVTKMYGEGRAAIAAGLPEGPFTGVPFLLKDLTVFYAGVPTSQGSRFFADLVPDHDSEIIARYKRAGLVIFGKTNTPELGISISTEPRLFGPAHNPWDLARTPGGSSGGTAAAVCAGIVPMASASDGGGSIRVPAACCGLFGMKPTRARTPYGPDAGESWAGMSTLHAITRTVRDSAALLDAVSGPDAGAPYFAPPPERPFLEEVGRSPGKLRIALSDVSINGAEVHPDCRAALGETARLCGELGHEVVEASPAFDAAALDAARVTIVAVNLKRVIGLRAKAVGRPPGVDDLENVTRIYLERAERYDAADYVQATWELHRAGRQMAVFFEKGSFDALLTPTMARPPFPLGELSMMNESLEDYFVRHGQRGGFTAIANITGQPAMSVPLHWTEGNLPVGAQFFGRYGEEGTLFRLAGQLEAARPWRDRRPEMG
ncbi:MAG: amidase [bacterium]|nr:amidase [bacterium]